MRSSQPISTSGNAFGLRRANPNTTGTRLLARKCFASLEEGEDEAPEIVEEVKSRCNVPDDGIRFDPCGMENGRKGL